VLATSSVREFDSQLLVVPLNLFELDLHLSFEVHFGFFFFLLELLFTFNLWGLNLLLLEVDDHLPLLRVEFHALLGQSHICEKTLLDFIEDHVLWV